MEKTTYLKLEELLALALKVEGTEMGLIRNYDPKVDELIVISHRGFSPEYIARYHSVKPFDRSCCGRAFGIGSTVLINDINADLSFKKEVKTIKALNAEFRAIKSVPLVTPRGRKVGVYSSHFKDQKLDWHFEAHDKILKEIADLLT